jgi:hypothetical protein
MEIFGRADKADYLLKTLNVKQSHVERIKKYCVRTKTGSLGGKRGSTMRKPFAPDLAPISETQQL